MGKKGPNSGRGNQSNGNDDFADSPPSGVKNRKPSKEKKSNNDMWGESMAHMETESMNRIKARVAKLLIVGFFVDYKKIFGGDSDDSNNRRPPNSKNQKEAESIVDRLKRYADWTQKNMTLVMCIGFVVLLFTLKAGEEGWRPGVQESEAINPYDALGVSRSASQGEIRKAFKKLAMEWHPDKHDVDCVKCKERFNEISVANDKVGTPEARKAYDANKTKRKELQLGSSVQLDEETYEKKVKRGNDVWVVLVVDHHDSDSGNALWAEMADTADAHFVKFGHADVSTPEGANLVNKVLGVRTVVLPMVLRLCSGSMPCSVESQLVRGRDKGDGVKMLRRFIYDSYPTSHLPYLSSGTDVSYFLSNKRANKNHVVLAVPYASTIMSNTGLSPAAESTGFKSKIPRDVKEAAQVVPVFMMLWAYKLAYEYANLDINFAITDFDSLTEAAQGLSLPNNAADNMLFFQTHQESQGSKSLQEPPFMVLSNGASLKGDQYTVDFIPPRANAASGAAGNGKQGLEVYGEYAMAELKNRDEDKALKFDEVSRKLKKSAKVDAADSFLRDLFPGESKSVNNAAWFNRVSEISHSVENAEDSSDLSESTMQGGPRGANKSKLLVHQLNSHVQNVLLADPTPKKLTVSNHNLLCNQRPAVPVTKRQCLFISDNSRFFSDGASAVSALQKSKISWLSENAEQIMGVSGGENEERESILNVMPVKILLSDALGLKKQYPVKKAFSNEILGKFAAADASFNEDLVVGEFSADKVARVQNDIPAELFTGLVYDDIHMNDLEAPLSFMMADDMKTVLGEVYKFWFGDYTMVFVIYLMVVVFIAAAPEAKSVKKIQTLLYVGYPAFIAFSIFYGSYELRKTLLSVADFS